MENVNATLSYLVTELNKADIALAIGFSAKETRKWKAYRKAIKAEIARLDPIDPEIAAMSDEDLVAALQD